MSTTNLLLSPGAIYSIPPDEIVILEAGNDASPGYTTSPSGGMELRIKLRRSQLTVDIAYQPSIIVKLPGKDYSEFSLVTGMGYITYGETSHKDVINYLAGSSSSMVLAPALTNDTLMRDLEKLAPRRGYVSEGNIDQSIASLGSAASANLSVDASGDIVYYVMGISQDTLGTSPHASYIQLKDVVSGVILTRIKGAVVPYAYGMVRTAAGNDDLVLEAYNGDTLAHWFYANALVVQS